MLKSARTISKVAKHTSLFPQISRYAPKYCPVQDREVNLNRPGFTISFPRSFSTTIEQASTPMTIVENPAEKVKARKTNRVYSAERLSSVQVSSGDLSIQAVSIKGTISEAIPEDSKTTVFFLTEGQVKNLASVAGFSSAIRADFPYQALFSASSFTGKNGTTVTLPGAAEDSVVVIVGLGALNDGFSNSSEHVGLNGMRLALHKAVKTVKAAKRTSATFVLPTISISAVEKVKSGFGSGIKSKAASTEDIVPLKKAASEASIEAIVDLFARVVVTSNHSFDKYKTEPTDALLSEFTLASVPASVFSTFETAVNVAESVLMARELGSERADVANPAYMQSIAENLEKSFSSIKVTTLHEEELRSQGFNLITAVGQAATVPPRIVAIEYNNSENQDDTPVALVGKGITFDTGGLNLKPTGFMEEMHADMCGSAAVISTMRALAVTKPQIRVVGILCLAENAIDAKSYKPYDIIESYQGSVIIGNTDAEGRLALADGLTYVQNTYKPEVVLDVATLTGACVVALGEVSAGIFSNDYQLSSDISTAGLTHNERFWPLPIFPEHQEELKNELADIQSTGKGRFGGASTAAAFLEKFIHQGVSWAHLDIAGPSNYSGPRQDLPKGITGYAVQTFYNFLVKKN